MTFQICAQAWLKIANTIIDIKFVENSNCILLHFTKYLNVILINNVRCI